MADATDAELAAEWAIRNSISHTEIMHLESDPELASLLAAECNDHVQNGDVHEYWGTRDGHAWRVHLTTSTRA